MKYSINNLENSQIEIIINLNKEDLLPYKTKALKEFSLNLEIEGFRKGKSPLNLVEQKVPALELAEKTASFAIEEIYPKIIVQEKITALGYPEIIITKLVYDQELEFKVKVAILKEIVLPDYKKIAKEEKKNKKTDIQVTDQEVEETLKWIYSSRTKEKDFKKEPKIDDEFAISLGHFKNLEELKKSIREGIEMEKRKKEEEKWRIELMEKISQEIKWDLPEILIETELHKMIEELKIKLEDIGISYDDYLKQIKKTEEDLRNDLREQAEKRVKIALILKEIAKKENITVSDEEIEERANRIISQVYDENLKEKIDLEQLKEFVKNLIENEKVFSLLESL